MQDRQINVDAGGWRGWQTRKDGFHMVIKSWGCSAEKRNPKRLKFWGPARRHGKLRLADPFSLQSTNTAHQPRYNHPQAITPLKTTRIQSGDNQPKCLKHSSKRPRPRRRRQPNRTNNSSTTGLEKKKTAADILRERD